MFLNNSSIAFFIKKIIGIFFAICFLLSPINSSAQDDDFSDELDDLFFNIDALISGNTGGIDSLVTNEVTEFFYHPSSKLDLGKGLSNADPVTYKKDCFEFDEDDSNEDETAIETYFSRHEIKSFEELRETLNFSGSISARLKFAKKVGGDAGLSFAKGHTFSRESLMIIMKMEANYSQKEAHNLRIKPRWEEKLKAGETEFFLRHCGSHVVTSVDRKALVFAVIRSNNLTTTTKNEVKASLGVNADLAVASLDAKVNGEEVFNREQKQGTLSVSFHAIGGAGPEQVGQLANAHSVEEIQDAFKTYLDGFKEKDEPQAIVYNVTPLYEVFPEYWNQLYTEVRNPNGALERLLDEYELLILELSRLRPALTDGNLPDADKRHYLKAGKARAARAKQLDDIARKFLSDFDYKFSEDPDYADIIQNGELPPLTPIRWYEPKVVLNDHSVTLTCNSGKTCQRYPGAFADFDGTLRLSVNLEPIDQIRSIKLQANYADGINVDIPNSLRTRENISSGSMGGSYSYRILRFSEDVNLETYRQMRNENPVFNLIVVRSDKTEQKFRLNPLVLEGIHR